MTQSEWNERCASWMEQGADGVRGGPHAFLAVVAREYGMDDALYNPVFAARYAAELGV